MFGRWNLSRLPVLVLRDIERGRTERTGRYCHFRYSYYVKTYNCQTKVLKQEMIEGMFVSKV